jgi:hypothetical protein
MATISTGLPDFTVQAGFLGDVPSRRTSRPSRRAGHRADIEILDPDHVEPAREVRGGLLRPVLAPVCLTGLDSRYRGLDSQGRSTAR